MPDFGEEVPFVQQIINAYDMLVEEFGEEAAKKNYYDSAVRMLRSYIEVGAFENAYVEAETAKELIDKSGITNGFNEVNQRTLFILLPTAVIIPMVNQQ